MAKKQKEKVVYIDDGRTIADMSGITSRPLSHNADSRHPKPLRAPSPIKEHFKTFFNAMGLMFLPTLAIVGILIAAFAIVYWLL